MAILVVNQCEVCGYDQFSPPIDSILVNHYPFITKQTLKCCNRCGTPYFFCEQCNHLLFRVHLALDSFGILSQCPPCKRKYPLVQTWLHEMRKKGNY